MCDILLYQFKFTCNYKIQSLLKYLCGVIYIGLIYKKCSININVEK